MSVRFAWTAMQLYRILTIETIRTTCEVICYGVSVTPKPPSTILKYMTSKTHLWYNSFHLLAWYISQLLAYRCSIVLISLPHCFYICIYRPSYLLLHLWNHRVHYIIARVNKTNAGELDRLQRVATPIFSSASVRTGRIG